MQKLPHLQLEISAQKAPLLGSFLLLALRFAVPILLIAAVLKNLMKYAGVEAFLSGVRPCVVAMILATALNMMLSTLGGIKTLADGFAPDARSILVFAVLWAVHFVWKKRTQKAPSPIGMILLAAGLGILFWGV